MNIDELLMYIQPFVLTNDVHNKSRIASNEMIIDECSNTDDNNEEFDASNEIDKNVPSNENQNIDVNIDKIVNIDDVNVYVRDCNNGNENKDIMINKSKKGIIHQKDPIFWCIYIHQNGIKEYQLNNKKHSNIIIEHKHNLVNYLQSNADVVKIFAKKNKITIISMKEMLSEILSNEPINFNTVSMFSLYYDVQIYFVSYEKKIWFCVGDKDVDNDNVDDNDVFIEYIVNKKYDLSNKNNNDAQIFSSPFQKKYNYRLIDNDEKEFFSKNKSNYHRIQDVNKPLFAISKYKSIELKEIALKLGIVFPSKILKAELYSLIGSHLSQ